MRRATARYFGQLARFCADLGGRVRLELKGADIIIHSVAGRGRSATPEEALPSPEELYIEEDCAPEKKQRTLLGRLRQGRKSSSQGGGTPPETMP